jgi:CelD/BcsL family acetyltransferase involved in cellulose biosynthesis
MKGSVLRPDELEASHVARWRALQSENDHLQSPYFAVEFTCAVGAVRSDVFVTVVEAAGSVVGYFPFQRGPLGAGRPVAGSLSDAHGVIAAPSTPLSAASILRQSHLAYWEFDHLVAGQCWFEPCAMERAVSPALDLSRGFDAYRAGRARAGHGRIQQLERKARKMAREVGPLRFEAHGLDREALECVLRWKSEQCVRTGVPDFFARAWTRELVERILAIQEPQFSGALSTLRAGDQLVAAHVGMRSATVWHWWFPGYDVAYAAYSPGSVLLLRVAEAAAAQGLRILDLGKGDDPYKQSFADCEIPLFGGCATRPSVAVAARRAAHRAEAWLRASPLFEPAKPVLRRARQWVRGRAYA